MHDSLVLAEKLVKHCGLGVEGDECLEKALAEYEEDMFSRAKDHVEDDDHMVKTMFAQNAVELWLQMFGMSSEGDDP